MLIPGLLLALELSGEQNEQLARRLQARDPAAMAELYDRFGRLVYSVILAVVRDKPTAEDLVQETFLRVWNRMAAFNAEKGALGPWLLAIGRNCAIDHVRSAGSRMERNSLEFTSCDHPSLFIDPERGIFNADHAKMIRKALDRLTDNQKKVIELAYYEGMSQTEMAERMSQPLGTIKTWVRTALRVLREELGQEEAA